MIVFRDEREQSPGSSSTRPINLVVTCIAEERVQVFFLLSGGGAVLCQSADSFATC